ncbi:MAG: hypothetical protein ABSH34_24010 [Verrucomicrobiota bacterium]|jgi:hypothetical protein
MFRLYRFLVGFLTLAGSLALAACLLWLGWSHFGPRKPQVSASRRQVAEQVVPSVVEDLRKNKGSVQTVAFLHLVNDPADYVTDQLRATIEQSGFVDLLDRRVGEKLERALNLRVASVGELDAAVRQGKVLGVQGVIFGRVNSFESYPDGAKLDLEISLADVAGRQVLFTKRYHKEIPGGPFNPAAIEDSASHIGGVQRLLAWGVVVLLLPVFTISFIRVMVRKESNRANAFTLGIYTAADALLAYLLLGAGVASLLSALLFVLVVGVAFTYNVFIMTFALKMEP